MLDLDPGARIGSRHDRHGDPGARGPLEPVPPPPIERPDFEIVPRAGLPIVAVVLGLLIAAIESNKLWPLMFFHVAGGAAWTIIDLFLGLVLGPIIGRMSIPAGSSSRPG